MVTAINKSLTVSRFIQDNFHPNKLQFKKFETKKPELLIVGDLDHTLIPWSEGKYREEVTPDFLIGNQNALQTVKEKALFVAATGIDFESLREIKDLLDGFPPIDFAFNDNGKIVYVNKGNQRQSEWLSESLTQGPNQDFEHFLNESIGWNRHLFFNVLEEVLTRNGMNEISPKAERPRLTYKHHKVYISDMPFPLTAVFCEGESAIYLVKTQDIEPRVTSEAGKIIADEIVSTYGKNKPEGKIKFNISEHDKYFYIFFFPDHELTIDKSTSFDITLSMLPDEIAVNIKAAIALGDSANDTHIKRTEIEMPKRKIPVYSLISGDSLLNNPDVSSHPRLNVAPEMGNIGKVFLKVINQIG